MGMCVESGRGKGRERERGRMRGNEKDSEEKTLWKSR